MQDTRLNRLVDVALGQSNQWLNNPWRRFSLLVISLLLGFFLGTAIPTTAGQRAELDLLSAGIIALLIEGVNRVVYSYRFQARPLLVDLMNALKIGLTYSLFVEAFKLAS